MNIEDSRIDAGKAFDRSKTSEYYATLIAALCCKNEI